MEFREAIESGDLRIQLLAIRDAIAQELSVSRCHTCAASRLRTGDQAALYLRLAATLTELAAIPEPSKEITGLAAIRADRPDNVFEIRPGASA